MSCKTRVLKLEKLVGDEDQLYVTLPMEWAKNGKTVVLNGETWFTQAEYEALNIQCRTITVYYS